MLFDVHTDNELALAVFLALQTQWRVVLGATRTIYQGIDYGSVPPVLTALGVPAEQFTETFVAVRTMEGAALAVLNAPSEDSDGG